MQAKDYADMSGRERMRQGIRINIAAYDHDEHTPRDEIDITISGSNMKAQSRHVIQTIERALREKCYRIAT